MDDRIIGELELVGKSEIIFAEGTNNFVICDNTFGPVVLENSKINFRGSNSFIYIVGGNTKSLKIKATLNSDNCIYIGHNSSFHKSSTAHIAASEGASIVIGNDCLISRDIWIRTGDAHPIYSVKTKQRVNNSKHVLIGDHVWIGQGVTILKGAIVGSGAIVGINSLLTHNKYLSNTAYAGSPARPVSKIGAVFFNKPDINEADKETLNKIKVFNSNKYVYKYSKTDNEIKNVLAFLSSNADMQERINYFKNLTTIKNRFAVSTKLK